MVWSFVISRFPHQGWLVSLSLRGASLMGKRYSTVFGRNPSEMVSECCLSYKQGHVGIYNFWRFSVNWTLNNCDVCCKLLSLRVISHIFRVYLFYKWSLEWSPCPRRGEWEPPGENPADSKQGFSRNGRWASLALPWLEWWNPGPYHTEVQRKW